ncbi:MAG: DNA-3-methyladenine glycosylase family protein [Gammaproteobacteria bacterium]
MPYRLDLTVSVLRRLSTNLVDLLTPEGMYVRALSGFSEPVIVRVRQVAHQRSLSITIDGGRRNDSTVIALVRRTLGVDRNLRNFHRAAARIAWLAPLVKRMRGVKPPRYPSLWEACANAIVFQQLSLRAASTIMHRLIVAVGRSVKAKDISVPLYLFPTVESFQRASHAHLRTTGLSSSKIATLRRVCESLASGALDATVLEQCTSPEAEAILQRIKGIGPWTAAVILLRGLGRLDVFPANDTSIASNIALVAGPAPFDVRRMLDTLGAQRGMLYFHLLLARLEARGEIGLQSFDRHPADIQLDRRS